MTKAAENPGEIPRQAGVVLHPTSLPGPRGIGQIGAAARAFVADLKEMGCTLWQVLPLGPTSFGDSPYQCLSSYAANHLLIDLDDLVADGLLAAEALADYPAFNPREVDYGRVIEVHNGLLTDVAEQFATRASQQLKQDFEAFCQSQEFWLDDYCLFIALKDANGGKAWHEWPRNLVRREKKALASAAKKNAKTIERHKIWQFLFSVQWGRLRRVCQEYGVRIMGDIPIFVAHDSADVWACPQQYFLHEDGLPEVIAGVPPDYFSETGQRWGNPLYRWDVMAEDGFSWWCQRLETVLAMVDLVRIDHFRGFEAYWEIDANEETAINGKWVPGPGEALFDAFERTVGTAAIIAEDLGVITPEVEALRDRYQLPGMKVLQFILGNEHADQLPDNFPPRSVCYTGTHDNDTTIGWFQTAEPHEVEAVKKHLNTDGEKIHEDFMRAAWHSQSAYAMALMQDVLGLGSEGRLNLPGSAGGNWRWRYEADQLTPEKKAFLHGLTTQAGRLNNQGEKRSPVDRP